MTEELPSITVYNVIRDIATAVRQLLVGLSFYVSHNQLLGEIVAYSTYI